MILKAFKQKSNKDYVNTILDKRVGQIDGCKLKSAAVLLNRAEFNDAERFRSFLKELGLSSAKNRVVFFADNEQEAQKQWAPYFSGRDFGWNGRIKNADLQEFIEETYDVLIAYYSDDLSEMHQIVAMSKAKFKVGLHSHDERLFDLIVSVTTNQFDVFKDEFKKYLKILKKI